MDRTFVNRVALLLWLLPLAIVFAGCGAQADTKPELTIFAASSLSDVFEELGEEYERDHPDVQVRFNFAGTSTLLTQLDQGAPADVFASADMAKMEAALQAGIVTDPEVFAKSYPAIIVPSGNPARVESLHDFGRTDLDLVLAQDGVPIAEYTKAILKRADVRYGGNFQNRVMENVVSREPDVRAAASRVTVGEADATFVYASDVTPGMRRGVDVVEIPKKLNVTATYPIAAVTDAPNPDLARDWVELVQEEEGQRAVGDWGFKRVR
ncbi:molybdate ABC transporter substrate-binding protein [soil metagenome]